MALYSGTDYDLDVFPKYKVNFHRATLRLCSLTMSQYNGQRDMGQIHAVSHGQAPRPKFPSLTVSI